MSEIHQHITKLIDQVVKIAKTLVTTKNNNVKKPVFLNYFLTVFILLFSYVLDFDEYL